MSAFSKSGSTKIVTYLIPAVISIGRWDGIKVIRHGPVINVHSISAIRITTAKSRRTIYVILDNHHISSSHKKRKQSEVIEANKLSYSPLSHLLPLFH